MPIEFIDGQTYVAIDQVEVLALLYGASTTRVVLPGETMTYATGGLDHVFIFEDGAVAKVMSKSVLSRLLPATKLYFVVGRKYECKHVLGSGDWLLGSSYECTGTCLDSEGHLSSYIFNDGTSNSAIYCSTAYCVFGPEGGNPRARTLADVTTELYDAVKSQGDVDALLMEFQTMTGKKKPGFM